MKHKEIKLEEFTIVGISIRTSNEGGHAAIDIPKLWTDFMSNNLFEKIPNKISNDVYCIYTDYEGDFTAPYRTILGCAVSSIENLAEGLEIRYIKSGNYLKFVGQGALPECVGQTWNHIWQNTYNRAYLADFDVYGEESKDPSNAEVKTYLSVK